MANLFDLGSSEAQLEYLSAKCDFLTQRLTEELSSRSQPSTSPALTYPALQVENPPSQDYNNSSTISDTVEDAFWTILGRPPSADDKNHYIKILEKYGRKRLLRDLLVSMESMEINRLPGLVTWILRFIW